MLLNFLKPRGGGERCLKSRYSGVKSGMLGKRAMSRGIRWKIQVGLFFESRSKPKANPLVPDKRVESAIIVRPCNETMDILKIMAFESQY
jgi:hypothetical protein